MTKPYESPTGEGHDAARLNHVLAADQAAFNSAGDFPKTRAWTKLVTPRAEIRIGRWVPSATTPTATSGNSHWVAKEFACTVQPLMRQAADSFEMQADHELADAIIGWLNEHRP